MNFENIYESYNYLKENVEIKPEIGIILGSGLGDVVNLLSDKQIISYKDIPHFPCSNVVGKEKVRCATSKVLTDNNFYGILPVKGDGIYGWLRQDVAAAAARLV